MPGLRGVSAQVQALLAAAARRVPTSRLRRMVRGLRRLSTPEGRTVWLLERSRRVDLLQPSPHTWEERYPALFDALAERLAHFPQPRLLSFGCSTGEEVRALRRRLPDALIDAVEVNPRSIARARAAGSDPKTRYIVADRPDPAARYDAVLALAVFRHRELEGYAPSSCAGILPFASAAQAAARLDAVLVPGGWLAFANANFCLLDLLPDAGYAPEPERFGVPEAVTLYGPDDMRLSGEVYTPVLFRKPAS